MDCGALEWVGVPSKCRRSRGFDRRRLRNWGESRRDFRRSRLHSRRQLRQSRRWRRQWGGPRRKLRCCHRKCRPSPPRWVGPLRMKVEGSSNSLRPVTLLPCGPSDFSRASGNPALEWSGLRSSLCIFGASRRDFRRSRCQSRGRGEESRRTRTRFRPSYRHCRCARGIFNRARRKNRRDPRQSRCASRGCRCPRRETRARGEGSRRSRRRFGPSCRH